MNLFIFIPNLINEQQRPRLKYLDKILTKAEQSPCELGYQQLLYNKVLAQNVSSPQLTVPTAAFKALGLGHQPKQQGQQVYWLCAEPVQLQADLAAVYMLGNHHLQLSAQELEQIAALLQPLLDTHQLTLHMHDNHQWLLQYCGEPDAMTMDDDIPSPEALVGKDILSFIPKASQFPWQTLLTEIQMTLHQADFNLFRRQQGKPTVDSLWFYGGGCLPQGSASSEEAYIFADDVFSQGFSQFYGMHSLSLDFVTVIQHWLDASPSVPGYFIDLSFQPIHDLASYQQSLQNYDQQRFKPLVQLIRKYRNLHIHCYLGLDRVYHIPPGWFTRMFF